MKLVKLQDQNTQKAEKEVEIKISNITLRDVFSFEPWNPNPVIGRLRSTRSFLANRIATPNANIKIFEDLKVAANISQSYLSSHISSILTTKTHYYFFNYKDRYIWRVDFKAKVPIPVRWKKTELMPKLPPGCAKQLNLAMNGKVLVYGSKNGFEFHEIKARGEKGIMLRLNLGRLLSKHLASGIIDFSTFKGQRFQNWVIFIDNAMNLFILKFNMKKYQCYQIFWKTELKTLFSKTELNRAVSSDKNLKFSTKLNFGHLFNRLKESPRSLMVSDD